MEAGDKRKTITVGLKLQLLEVAGVTMTRKAVEALVVLVAAGEMMTRKMEVTSVEEAKDGLRKRTMKETVVVETPDQDLLREMAVTGSVEDHEMTEETRCQTKPKFRHSMNPS